MAGANPGRRAMVSIVWTLVVWTLVVWTLSGAQDACAQHEPFRRADANGDGARDVSDAVGTLLFLFAGTPPALDCDDAADANDDGAVDIADPVLALAHLFLGGPPPPAPSGDCGDDPTADALGCRRHPPCERPGDDLAALSDSFDGPSLDPSWTLTRAELVDVGLPGGELVLGAASRSLWFRDSRGPSLHKLVDGDFQVTATVRARRRTQPALPPALDVHLGGLIARDPASGAPGGRENYVFIVVGRDVDDLSVETKTTVDGESTFSGPSWGSGDAELRLCRDDAMFRLYKRAPGGDVWELAAAFARPDLPAVLEVGVIIYANAASPDLEVRFEEVTFGRVDGGCP